MCKTPFTGLWSVLQKIFFLNECNNNAIWLVKMGIPFCSLASVFFFGIFAGFSSSFYPFIPG